MQLPVVNESCNFEMKYFVSITQILTANYIADYVNFHAILYNYLPFLLSFSFKMGLFLREFPVAMALLGKFPENCPEKKPKKNIFFLALRKIWD